MHAHTVRERKNHTSVKVNYRVQGRADKWKGMGIGFEVWKKGEDEVEL